jgi:iron complex transport system substrate-binding protein
VGGVPKRVVSFAPNVTEMVFALTAGELLVGRTQRCNVPPEALKVPEIGAYLNPDFERVLASRPDLVLTNRSATRKEVVRRLDVIGIPVFVADTKTIDGICRVLTRVGTLLDREKRSSEIVAEIGRRRRAIQDQLPASKKPTVLFAVGTRPLVAAGGKSFIGALVREAGGINIAEDAAKPFARYSIEEVIRRDPDVILVLNKECTGEQCIELWREHAVLTAVRTGRVYALDADLMARPSPRIMDGLEELAGIFHSVRLGQNRVVPRRNP